MCDKGVALVILDEVYRKCSEVLPLTDAYLYGSYARGDFDSESDVDIMLISSMSSDGIWPKRRQISQIANALSTEHDVTVSVCVRSQEQFQPQAVPYYRNIISDGIRFARA